MRNLIGSKSFYKMVLAIAIPIMIQNGITHFVGLLDNIMVGQVGTEQMSGVAIANQLLFVFNLCIFGGVSGAGIFTAQFFGQKNHEGVKETFRFKLIVCSLLTVLSLCIFYFWGKDLIKLYLHDASGVGTLETTLMYSKNYLFIMLISLLPFAWGQAYSSTLRETGETVVPMIAGIVAVFVNLILNYILIFGKLGIRPLGCEGAAIATVISRFVECGIIIYWTHKHTEKNLFIKGAYKNFKVSIELSKQILIKGMPLLVNEAFWAAGMAMLMQCYSVRGLAVVAGLNIATTIANLFNIVFIALGNGVGIIVGPLLGAGKMKEAKDTAYKMIFFSVMCCLVMGGLMTLIAPVFSTIYNTSKEIKDLATSFIRIAALCMPIYAFLHATYFTIRSGGKTFITFLFDSVFLWLITVPVAFVLAYFTGLNILIVYLTCQLVDLIKCAIGYYMLKKDIWLHNLVEDKAVSL